ncbi:hypothetical protein [Nocardia sp. NPDC003345]
MFEPVAGDSLRQGDICMVSSFPKWSVGDLAGVLPGTTKKGILVADWDRLVEVQQQKLVCVCSYDCDLENPRSRSGILLAPVIRLPASPGSPQHESISSSWRANDDGAFDHLNIFPLKFDSAGDEYPDHAVVDFSAASTLGTAEKAVQSLEKTKLFEMTDVFRTWFQKKIAIFYARPGS